MGKSRDDTDAAIETIKCAIRRYGLAAGPDIARRDFVGVSRSTWHRWMKKVGATDRMRAAGQIRSAMEVIPADIMPVPPSPAIVARSPRAAVESFDFLAKLSDLYRDAEMLREFSAGKNADGSEKVKIPTFWGNSIKLRSDLLERHLEAQRMLFDFNQMKDFYSTIISEIEKIDPETCAKIMIRLDALNRERGFNISGQI